MNDMTKKFNGVEWYKNSLKGKNKPDTNLVFQKNGRLEKYLAETIKTEILTNIAQMKSPTMSKKAMEDIEEIEKIISKPKLKAKVFLKVVQSLKEKFKNSDCHILFECSSLNSLNNTSSTEIPLILKQRYDAMHKLAKIKPAIIAITPTKNRDEELKEIYKSLKSQKIKLPIAWLVADNVSTDKTKNFLDNVKDDDFVVRLDYNEKTGYPAVVRNFIINFLSATVKQGYLNPEETCIARIDSDDKLNNEYSFSDLHKHFRQKADIGMSIGKIIIDEYNKNNVITNSQIYPLSLRGDHKPEIKNSWDILDAGIPEVAGLIRLDLYLENLYADIDTVEDAFKRVDYDIAKQKKLKNKFTDDTLFIIKNEKPGNQSDKKAQENDHYDMDGKKIEHQISLSNRSFKNKRAKAFEHILDITEQQHNGDIYR